MIIIDTGAVHYKTTASDVWLIRCVTGAVFYVFQTAFNRASHRIISDISDGKFGYADLGEVGAYARSQGFKGVRDVV